MKHKQELAAFLTGKIQASIDPRDILTWLVEFEELKEEEATK